MNIRVDQLLQLRTLTRDGNLISSDARTRLHAAGLVGRLYGWNFLTEKGVEYLVNLGMAESLPVPVPEEEPPCCNFFDQDLPRQA